MPPANSPVGEPAHLAVARSISRTPSPSTFLPALRVLGSPVLDLASTLTIQAEDDTEADNINFLRTDPPTVDDAPPELLTRELRNERRRIQAQHRQQRDRFHEDSRFRHLQGRTSGFEDNLMQQGIARRYPEGQVGAGYSELVRQVPLSRYSSNVPSHQSLYDWAPASEEGNEAELEDILAELRQHQPNSHPDIIRHLGQAQVHETREARDQARLRNIMRVHQNVMTERTAHETSLRSQAAHNIRRNHRLSSRSREHLQQYLLDRYVLDRERVRSGEGNSSTSEPMSAVSPSSTTFRPHVSDGESSRSTVHGSVRVVETEAIERLRRRYLEEPSSSHIEKVMVLLNNFRKTADAGQTWNKFVVENRPTDWRMANDESVERLTDGFPVHSTSWLFPGTMFSGFQQAAPSSCRASQQRQSMAATSSDSPPLTTPTFDPSRPWLSESLTHEPPPAFSTLTASPPSMSPSHDRWTVKVAIHDVDYETGTLQGTMEAINVPSYSSASSTPSRSIRNPSPSSSTNHTSPSRSSTYHNVAGPPTNEKTFSTYVVGELIDFRNHTLITESFPSSSRTDAHYWRRLEPFASMTEEEVAVSLLDPEWLQKELQEKYVLMRWKEKCFVRETLSLASSWTRDGRRAALQTTNSSGGPPTNRIQIPASTSRDTRLSDDGYEYGLSIKGFYYISLRRSDGHIQGLYHDPESTPNQHLELQPSRGVCTVGGWEFR